MGEHQRISAMVDAVYGRLTACTRILRLPCRYRERRRGSSPTSQADHRWQLYKKPWAKKLCLSLFGAVISLNFCVGVAFTAFWGRFQLPNRPNCEMFATIYCALAAGIDTAITLVLWILLRQQVLGHSAKTDRTVIRVRVDVAVTRSERSGCGRTDRSTGTFVVVADGLLCDMCRSVLAP